jgi:hypothetical protein
MLAGIIRSAHRAGNVFNSGAPVPSRRDNFMAGEAHGRAG